MTTFTSKAGIVFTSSSGGADAVLHGAVQLKIIAENTTAPVTIFGGPSTSLASILRVGPGASAGPTLHDAKITLTGAGLPANPNWTFRFGVTTWSGGDTFVLFAQDSVTGRELMIPIDDGVTPFPTITTTAALRVFLLGIEDVTTTGGTLLLSQMLGSRVENDNYTGDAGNDRISLGIGADTAKGQGATDYIYGGDGNDKLYGGADNDSVTGGADRDRLQGDTGSDRLYGGGGNDRLLGGADNDLIEGGADADTLEGGGGDDLMHGDGGNDQMLGGAGRDQMDGGLGNDTLKGGDASDVMIADWGTDVLYGNDGDDVFYSDGYYSTGHDGTPDGLDILYGGGGKDYIQEGNGIPGGTNRIYGDGGNDTITGSGNDRIFGGIGADFVRRDGGNSYVEGGLGNDTLKGYLGRDTLIGGGGDDQLFGSQKGFSLANGGAGNDTLVGGGFEQDKLLGGTGADTFDISLTASGAQRLTLNGGTGVDRAYLKTYDSVSDITRDGGQITLTGSNGAKIVFNGIEKYHMTGWAAMTGTQFYDFWDDLLN